jgi:hypothetical protein
MKIYLDNATAMNDHSRNDKVMAGRFQILLLYVLDPEMHEKCSELQKINSNNWASLHKKLATS